jgi:hypothetical protein
MPLILISQEAEIRSQHDEIILEILEKRARGVAQGVGFEFKPSTTKEVYYMPVSQVNTVLIFYMKNKSVCLH